MATLTCLQSWQVSCSIMHTLPFPAFSSSSSLTQALPFSQATLSISSVCPLVPGPPGPHLHEVLPQSLYPPFVLFFPLAPIASTINSQCSSGLPSTLASGLLLISFFPSIPGGHLFLFLFLQVYQHVLCLGLLRAKVVVLMG